MYYDCIEVCSVYSRILSTDDLLELCFYVSVIDTQLGQFFCPCFDIRIFLNCIYNDIKSVDTLLEHNGVCLHLLVFSKHP